MKRKNNEPMINHTQTHFTLNSLYGIHVPLEQYLSFNFSLSLPLSFALSPSLSLSPLSPLYVMRTAAQPMCSSSVCSAACVCAALIYCRFSYALAKGATNEAHTLAQMNTHTCSAHTHASYSLQWVLLYSIHFIQQCELDRNIHRR